MIWVTMGLALRCVDSGLGSNRFLKPAFSLIWGPGFSGLIGRVIIGQYPNELRITAARL